MKKFITFGLLLAVTGLIVLFATSGGDYLALGKQAFLDQQWTKAANYFSVCDPSEVRGEALLFYGTSRIRQGMSGSEQGHALLAKIEADPKLGARATLQRIRGYVSANDPVAALATAKSALEKHGPHPVREEAALEARINAFRLSFGATDKFWFEIGGANIARRSRSRMERIVSSSPETYEKDFEQEYMALAREPAGKGSEPLRKLIADIRTDLSSLLPDAEQLLDRNPAAYYVAAFVAQTAASAKNSDLAEKAGSLVLRLVSEELAEPELRFALEYARRDALTSLCSALEQTKNISRAIEILEANRANFLNPGHVDDRLGRLYHIAGEHKKLDALATKWLKREPTNSYAAFYRGSAIFGLGEARLALPYLERSAAADPNNATFQKVLGQALVAEKQFARAIPCLDRAAKTDPWDFEITYTQAQALVAAGDASQARTKLRDAIQQYWRSQDSPGNQKLAPYLRELYQAVGQDIGSLKVAQDLYNAEPTNPFVALRYAQLLAESGGQKEALELALRVGDKNPKMNDAWRLAARIAFDKADFAACRRALDRLEPLLTAPDATLPFMRGRMLLSEGKTAQARGLLKTAANLDPNLIAVDYALLELENKEGRHGACLDLATRLLDKFPDDLEVKRALVDAYRGLGQEDKALETTKAILEAHRGVHPLDFLLKAAQLFRSAKDAKSAQLALAQAAEQSQDNPIGLISIGQAMLEVQQYRPAMECAERAIKLARDVSLRRRARDLLLRSSHYAQDWVVAYTAAAEMKRERLLPEDLLTTFAASRAAWPETLAAAKGTGPMGGAPAYILISASQALVALGFLAEAEIWLQSFSGKVPERRAEADVFMAIVEADLQDPTRAVKRFRSALAQAPKVDPSSAGSALIKRLISRDAKGEALEIASLIMQRPRVNPELRITCARAAVEAGELSLAVSWLRSAPKGERTDRLVALEAALHLVTGQSLQSVVDLKNAPGPDSRRIAELAAAQGTNPALPPSSIAHWLKKLREAKFEEATAGIAALRDVPEPAKPMLLKLVTSLKSASALAPERVQRLIPAFAAMSVGLMPRRAASEIEALRQELPEASAALSALLVTASLISRDPVAQDLAFERTTKGPVEFEVFCAAIEKARQGAPALTKSLDEAKPSARDWPTLLVAIATELARQGNSAAAFAAYSLLPDQKYSDSTRVNVCIERLQFELASRLAQPLIKTPPHSDPNIEAVAVLGILRNPDRTEPGLPRAQALLSDGAKRARIHPLLRLELQLKIDDQNLAQYLNEALSAAPYQSWTIDQVCEILRRARRAPETVTALEDCLDLLDPNNSVRRLLRQDRPASLF